MFLCTFRSLTDKICERHLVLLTFLSIKKRKYPEQIILIFSLWFSLQICFIVILQPRLQTVLILDLISVRICKVKQHLQLFFRFYHFKFTIPVGCLILIHYSICTFDCTFFRKILTEKLSCYTVECAESPHRFFNTQPIRDLVRCLIRKCKHHHFLIRNKSLLMQIAYFFRQYCRLATPDIRIHKTCRAFI